MPQDKPLSTGAKVASALAVAGGIWLALREPSAEELQRQFHEAEGGSRKRRRKHKLADVGALPTHGRIPMVTVQRALKTLGRKAKTCRITAAALREGMEVEREHRDVTHGASGKTARIAAAHLCERPDYYKRLKRFVEK